MFVKYLTESSAKITALEELEPSANTNLQKPLQAQEH